MAVRHAPAGLKILLGSGFFILTFILARPSDPVTKSEYAFWNKLAGLFGENDVEGFVGIALLVISAVVAMACYKIAIHLIERHLNKPQ